MFLSLLNKLPGGENAKVFMGVVMLCGAAWLPLQMKGAAERLSFARVHATCAGCVNTCHTSTLASPTHRPPYTGGANKVGFDTMAEKKEAQRIEAESKGPEALAAWNRKEEISRQR